jgi:hypothetical protein
MDIIRCIFNNYGKTFIKESQEDRIDNKFSGRHRLKESYRFLHLDFVNFLFNN